MGNIVTSQAIDTNQSRIHFWESNKNDIILRKTIHDILVNKTDIIQGQQIYTNQMKAMCKIAPVSTDKDTNGNYTSLKPVSRAEDLTNSINVSLPHIIDTMVLTKELNKTIKTTITKSDIILNITNKESNMKNINDETIAKFTDGTKCPRFMNDMCAKQLYNNSCIKLINNTWMWDYNNSRCVIDDINTLTKKVIKFNDQDDNTTPGLNYDYKKIQINKDIINENNYLFKFLDSKAQDFVASFTVDLANTNSETYKFLEKNFGYIPFTNSDLYNMLVQVNITNETKINSIKHSLFINYLNQFEVIYKTPLNLNKILNYGDKTCACVNSGYGDNLTNFPSDKCPLFTDEANTSPFTIELMLEILNNYDINQVGIPISTNMISDNAKKHINKFKEVQACLGYYFYNDKFKLVKPRDYNPASQYYNSLMKPYSIDLTKTYDLNNVKSTYYSTNYGITTNKNKADVYFDNKINNDKTSIRGSGSLNTNATSIYSAKLGNIATLVTNSNPYSDNMTCNTLINNDDNQSPEKPFLYMGNFIKPNIVCQNIISINNSISRDININPQMTNICGNTGLVQLNYYKPEEKTNNYCCALTKNITFIILSKFNININDTTFNKYNSLFSNFNGIYSSCKSPLNQNIQLCKGITTNDHNIFIKKSDPNIYIQFIPYNDSSGNGFNITLIKIINNVPTTILVSRLFTYTANDSESTEEMCLANSFLSKHILNNSLGRLSETDKGIAINKYIERNGPISTSTSALTEYNWLYDPSLFDDLTSNSKSTSKSITYPGVITRSIIDNSISGIENNKMNGTKFLLGNNSTEFYVSCDDSTSNIWGCGKFIVDVDNLNSFMILNDRDYNYNNYRDALYNTDEYSDITKILKLPKSKIIYSPAIYRYILITPENNINYIIAVSDETNEVLGIGASILLKSANIINVDFAAFTYKDNEYNLAIKSPPTATAERTWTVLSKNNFELKLGNIVKNNVTIIQLTIDALAPIIIIRDLISSPYSFINEETKWEVNMINNKWIISKNNIPYFNGILSQLDFSGVRDYWTTVSVNNSYKKVSINTFSQYYMQIKFNTLLIPDTTTFLTDITKTFLNKNYFNNNSNLFISNLTTNYIKSSNSSVGYILLQFGINTMNKILLHNREVGYLLNHLILNIPYIFDDSTNKIAISDISNATAFYDITSNDIDSTNSNYNYANNIDNSTNGFLMQNLSYSYIVDSFLMKIKLLFTPLTSVQNQPPSLLSQPQINYLELYLNNVIYDSLYTIPEFNYSGPIIVKYIINPQVIDTSTTPVSISYNFKIYYMYQLNNNIIKNLYKLINNNISLSIANLVQYNTGSTSLNIQNKNTPVGDFIYYLNNALSNSQPIIFNNTSLDNLKNYTILPVLTSIYISEQTNLISTDKINTTDTTNIVTQSNNFLSDAKLITTSSNTPSNTPSNTLSNTLSTTPSNTPSNTLSNTLSTTPSNTHSNTPSNTHSNTPSNTHSNTPSNTPSTTTKTNEPFSDATATTTVNTQITTSIASNTYITTPNNTSIATPNNTSITTPNNTFIVTSNNTMSVTNQSDTQNLIQSKSMQNLSNWSICIFDKTTLNNILSLAQLTHETILTNQFTNLYKLIIENINKLNDIITLFRNKSIDISVLNQIDTIIITEYKNVACTILLQTITDFIKQYDLIASNKIQSEFIKLQFTPNTSADMFNLFITNIFIKLYAPQIDNDIKLNIFKSINSNKYYYKKYMSALTSINILYADVSKQIVVKLQSVINTYIIRITSSNDPTLRLSSLQTQYNNCNTLSSCLNNLTEINNIWMRTPEYTSELSTSVPNASQTTSNTNVISTPTSTPIVGNSNLYIILVCIIIIIVAVIYFKKKPKISIK